MLTRGSAGGLIGEGQARDGWLDARAQPWGRPNAERDRWIELLDAVTADVHVWEAELLEPVRRALSTGSSTYAATAQALREPKSENGRALLAALAEVAEDGVLGPVTSGVWIV